MREASIPVYGLSNDVGEWAALRRELLGIDGYFAGWVISGEVKSRKPELGNLPAPCRPAALCA